MSFNVNLPMGRSNSMSGLTGMRIVSKDPSSVDSVKYDSSNRVIEATYTLVDGTSETVTLTYTTSGWLVYNRVEYRDYEYDLFGGSILPVASSQKTVAILERRAREAILLANQEEILKQLKLMTIHLAVISSEEISEYEY